MENVIEFLKNQETATVTLSQGRFIGMIKRLAEKYPGQVEIIHDTDANGYFLAHVPVSWIKFRPPLEISDERKKELAERLNAFRKSPASRASFDAKTASDINLDSLYLPGGLEPFYDEIDGILTYA